MNRTPAIIIFTLLIMTSLLSRADISQPMYGSSGNSNNEKIASENAQFLAEATNTFGTREHASIGYVDSGFEAHLANKDQLAMQRFNEAWLLNPENPYAYVGFGVLYKKQQQYCKAKEMFTLAASKQLQESGFLADYALIISQCADSSSTSDRSTLFTKANEVYLQAEETPNPKVLAYVYQSWAESLLLQDNVEKARSMLDEAMALGATIKPDLAAAINEAGQ